MGKGGESSSKSVTANRSRKRVEAETSSATLLKRAKNGSAFVSCGGCNKDVPVGLIDFHNCVLEAQIKSSLEAQINEVATEVKKKIAEKNPSAVQEQSSKKPKKEKDPNKPKKPQTAFFLFMDVFRKQYKEEHPENKKVSVVAKEGGEKWKSMTDEEKKPYIDKAAEIKEEYQRALEAQNDAGNETADAEGEPNEDDGAPSEKEEKVEVVMPYDE